MATIFHRNLLGVLLASAVACTGNMSGRPTPVASPSAPAVVAGPPDPPAAEAPASAPAISPVPGPLPRAGVVIVAGGLDSPRGVALGRDGDIYLADSGAASQSKSGRLVRLTPDGTVTPILAGAENLTGAPHGQTYIFGLSDVAVQGDGLLVTVGFGVPSDEPPIAPNSLVKLDLAGNLTRLLDFDRLERDRDPDRLGPGSNATGIAVGPDGTVWVSDAGGNWVAHLASDGSVDRVVAFPAVDGEDAVPTGLAVGPDGNTYVALFRCIQPTEAKGGVARVRPDGAAELVASGLTSPIDVAFGPDGALHVLEFARDYAPSTGRVLRLAANGTTDVLADGLNYPTSFAIDGSGRAYITEMAGVAGGGPGTGRVVGVDLSTRR